MILILERFCYSPQGTFARLFFPNGRFTCYTVEDPWNQNRPFKSCIPEGVYYCRRGDFPIHGITFEVTRVPGRTAILFHVGNTIEDVQGCICPGEELGALEVKKGHALVKRWAVLDSAATFKRFMDFLEGTDQFDLMIRQYKP